MATGSYSCSFFRTGTDCGTGNSVTILRNGVSMRETRLGVMLYSLAIVSCLSRNRTIENLLVFPIPIHLLSLAITPVRHHHGNRMGEPGFDAPVGRLPVAHAAEPIVRVIFEVVILVDGRRC